MQVENKNKEKMYFMPLHLYTMITQDVVLQRDISVSPVLSEVLLDSLVSPGERSGEGALEVKILNRPLWACVQIIKAVQIFNGSVHSKKRNQIFRYFE